MSDWLHSHSLLSSCLAADLPQAWHRLVDALVGMPQSTKIGTGLITDNMALEGPCPDEALVRYSATNLVTWLKTLDQAVSETLCWVGLRFFDLERALQDIAARN